jgi:hypothetical protein
MRDHDMSKEYKEVGRVKEIYRYPVKSMAGEYIEEAKVGWHGLAGDRRFAFVRAGNKTGLPWLSARELPQLILYSARFTDPNGVENSPITIVSPDGRNLALDNDELLYELEQKYGDKLHLMQLWRGAYDSMDISLITEASVRTLSDKIGCKLEVQRFRPNLVIEAFEEKPYPEDRWVGELLVFGERDNSARIRTNRKDLRCMVVNLDPKTAQQNPAILKEIVNSRKNLLGIYGTTERPGTIRVGDVVRLKI